MSNFKLQFKLKQHTPIIHFQHNQHGATLRASELKPKLDKFLIEKLEMTETIKVNNKDKIVPKTEFINWFINKGKEHLALDYKVKIKANGEVEYYLPLPVYQNTDKQTLINKQINLPFSYIMPSPFFSNTDKITIRGNRRNGFRLDESASKFNEIRYGSLFKTLNIEVNSFSKPIKNKANKEIFLIDIVENYITEFFLINNFGTRQNKGFGSFTVLSINNKKIPKEKTNEILKDSFLKTHTINNCKNHSNIFKFILDEYALLKTGTNRPYMKSELFKHFINKDIRWEKRFIKQKLNANGVSLKQQNNNQYEPIDYSNNNSEYYNNYTDEQQNEYRFIRALLGLAENYEFATNNRERLKVKINSTETDKIERFKSPLFFKVIDNSIYLKTDNSYKNIEGEEFEFKDNNRSLGSLKVPENFDIDDFINKHISNNWKNI